MRMMMASQPAASPSPTLQRMRLSAGPRVVDNIGGAGVDGDDEDEDDENAKIINYAKMLKKTARQNMKEELNRAKIEMAMASLGYT